MDKAHWRGGFSMSESLWKSDEVEEAQPEQPVAEPKAESGALALSGDDFSALEERILRAVDVVKQERQARAAAEERATAAEAKLREQAPLAENLQKEVSALHAERDDVRERVERLLSQLDALEL
jgi:predicted  nucleic acid-binding Zn-ribbon protein